MNNIDTVSGGKGKTFRVLCASTKQEDHVNRLLFPSVNAPDKLHVAHKQIETTDSRLVRIQVKYQKNSSILDFVHSRTLIFTDQILIYTALQINSVFAVYDL